MSDFRRQAERIAEIGGFDLKHLRDIESDPESYWADPGQESLTLLIGVTGPSVGDPNVKVADVVQEGFDLRKEILESALCDESQEAIYTREQLEAWAAGFEELAARVRRIISLQHYSDE